jgi:BASS family bile acid:Na+ symporter
MKSKFSNEPAKGILYARRAAIVIAIFAAILLLVGVSGQMSYKPGGLLLLVALALGVKSLKILRGYSFTVWVLVCAGAAMIYPQAFIKWGGFKLELLIIPLTQLIMFGMGTTLSLADFARVAKSPLPIFTGLAFQFSVMPFVGYFIAKSFGFDGEIAAGIVLIGSVSGGVASNLMVYLARGNVALSVTMTFVSTMAAPIATPLLMNALAGRFVPIDTIQMMFSILNMIVIPVVAGLVAHEVLYSIRPWALKVDRLIMLIIGSAALAVISMLVGPEVLGPLYSGVMMGGELIAVITLTKLVMSIILKRPNTWMDRVLPLVSMAGICTIITIIIAQTHEVLMAIGITLLLAAMVHNAIGYSLGYFGSRGLGSLLGNIGYRLGLRTTNESLISETESRTIAFEVGMQNGGMATGLAIDVLHSHVAALPPNLFGTWMNISGSMLANYWKQRPTGDTNMPTAKNE